MIFSVFSEKGSPLRLIVILRMHFNIYPTTVEPQLSEHRVIRIPRLFEQFVHSASLNQLS